MTTTAPPASPVLRTPDQRRHDRRHPDRSLTGADVLRYLRDHHRTLRVVQALLGPGTAAEPSELEIALLALAGAHTAGLTRPGPHTVAGPDGTPVPVDLDQLTAHAARHARIVDPLLGLYDAYAEHGHHPDPLPAGGAEGHLVAADGSLTFTYTDADDEPATVTIDLDWVTAWYATDLPTRT